MEYNELIKSYKGNIVKNKAGNIGTIIDVSKRITVEFEDGEKKSYGITAFEDGFLTFVDNKFNVELKTRIDSMKKEKSKKVNEISSNHVSNVIRVEAKPTLSRKKPIDSMVGADYHIKNLERDIIIDYQEVEAHHGIVRKNFGRGINNVNDKYILLFSNMKKEHEQYSYDDVFTDTGNFIYTGEGQKGDQKLTGGNKCLKETMTNNIPVYLYIKFSKDEYYFQGQFKVIEIKDVIEKDSSGQERKVFKFTLEKVQNGIDCFKNF